MKPYKIVKKAMTLSVGLFFMFWMQNAIAGGVLSGMRIGQADDKTRVVFDLKQTAKYQVTQLHNPERIVVDFFDTASYLSFNKKHITDPRLFKIRASNNGQRVRVVLDLHQTPKFKSFLLPKNRQGKARLVVDLMDRSTPSKPISLAKKTDLKPTKSKQLAKSQSQNQKMQSVQKSTDSDNANQANGALLKRVASKQPLVDLRDNKNHRPILDKQAQPLLNQDSSALVRSSEMVIAIDAGHGGKDPGAVGYNGVYEKTVTLQIAKKLQRAINRQPGMKAILTRDKDVFIPLRERVAIAKRHHADLFVSVHADAFYDRSVRGGSVYVLSERGASSTMAKLLARTENAALQEIDLDRMEDDVAFALSDLSREANIKASRQLAGVVLKEMKKTVKMHKHSVQSAGFAVLKSIDMPSMLIEAAFISNPYEAKNLTSRAWQQKMANAITNGLSRYRAKMAPKPQWGETLYVQYRVQQGDTLSEIAESYQVSTRTLKKINNIKNADALYVGKQLKIPVTQKVMAGL